LIGLNGNSAMLTRRQATVTIGAAAALLTFRANAAGTRPTVTLHKDPTCSCCTAWGKHIEEAGFPVTVIESQSLKALNAKLGVPEDLAGCHTATVEGYVLEGHVPASALERLLRERPEAIGLSVPGMPAGSPGMGGDPEIYQVTLFTSSDRRAFARYKGAELLD